MQIIRAVVLLWVLIAGIAPTFARDLITCGDQVGKSYYLAGGIAPNDGWVDDGVDKSRLTLSVNDNGQYDIVETAGNVPFSYRAADCELIVVSTTGNIKAIAACSLTLDTFQFIIRGNNITMLLTQNKQTSTITKMAAFTAQCRRVGG
jgi:hypothetical protein